VEGSLFNAWGLCKIQINFITCVRLSRHHPKSILNALPIIKIQVLNITNKNLKVYLEGKIPKYIEDALNDNFEINA